MGEEDKSLDRTPTWAVAGVCSILIIISVLMEHTIHLSSQYFKKRRKSLYHALYKVRSELMLFGFMSLLLTVTKEPIKNICIPRSIAESFLPCKNQKLSNLVEEEIPCHEQGKVSLLSVKAAEELQILIFVLAFYHVLSCILSFALGVAKLLVNRLFAKLQIRDQMGQVSAPGLWWMKRWKAWEEETQTVEYQSTHDPRRFRLTRETTFAKRHQKFCSEHRLLCWPICFLRQFTSSVSKTDYTTLRHGFITAHLGERRDFNFQKYIKRTLDKDLQVVVGASIWIWMCCVLFIFFNANGFYSYFWLPFVPLVMLLVVGTKLQVVITKMCSESHDRARVILGSLIVTPRDNLFWFSRPKLLLHIMHFILFQNSFQMAFFTWTWYKFGLNSCFHRNTDGIVIKLVVGTIVQCLCGYVTLPLYALVTQMGSLMRKAVFPDHVILGLTRWHKTARGKVAIRKTKLVVETPSPSPPGASQNHLIVDVTEETQDDSSKVKRRTTQQTFSFRN